MLLHKALFMLPYKIPFCSVTGSGNPDVYANICLLLILDHS